jgi:hypothetical protein
MCLSHLIYTARPCLIHKNVKCEPDTAAPCKSNGKDTFSTLSSTAWKGNGMGTACYVWIGLYPPLWPSTRLSHCKENKKGLQFEVVSFVSIYPINWTCTRLYKWQKHCHEQDIRIWRGGGDSSLYYRNILLENDEESKESIKSRCGLAENRKRHNYLQCSCAQNRIPP